MRITKNGKRNLQDWSAQDFGFTPTPAADHMLELLDEMQMRLAYVGAKLERAHPAVASQAPLADVLAAMDKLVQFCRQFV